MARLFEPEVVRKQPTKQNKTGRSAAHGYCGCARLSWLRLLTRPQGALKQRDIWPRPRYRAILTWGYMLWVLFAAAQESLCLSIANGAACRHIHLPSPPSASRSGGIPTHSSPTQLNPATHKTRGPGSRRSAAVYSYINVACVAGSHGVAAGAGARRRASGRA